MFVFVVQPYVYSRKVINISVMLNPKYAIENLFRPKTTVNQPLCLIYVINHSGAMLFVHKSLILCSFESHYESY